MIEAVFDVIIEFYFIGKVLAESAGMVTPAPLLISIYIEFYVLFFSIFSTILLYSFQTTDTGELKQQIEIEPPVAG
ncbi:hypothetical protein HZS38_05240 [Xenorhabdus nematophila]|uniref:Uncharacterized protein n=1 Tax=Xenorhabdus nematophila (strain ATCC 19061 / DSM 3370 / CCUG 14189 / LMG 1036 / NCIMB 9965 / AN6) TaxID=406817 RepID=D3VIB2_XENNA|nr:hypothetical protein [Xenorhabdus nematophila]CEE90184.1 hypothetical protein XNA1_1200011 [Xenorhabdus nematophila str. Anatoliense]CEF30711.1 hypothetical protein XNW1_2810018 [Xenorhabdus nematophila str. Websteri]AYA39963.1 hypothetical protein D3790_05325 [Xenorhabdus nematophila]MBA0018598.1 hypothetical protein [Xenorhabdus nematophila]MCB4425623.1 hypothetical protein [Xenorhabdus nematophila]